MEIGPFALPLALFAAEEAGAISWMFCRRRTSCDMPSAVRGCRVSRCTSSGSAARRIGADALTSKWAFPENSREGLLLSSCESCLHLPWHVERLPATNHISGSTRVEMFIGTAKDGQLSARQVPAHPNCVQVLPSESSRGIVAYEPVVSLKTWHAPLLSSWSERRCTMISRFPELVDVAPPVCCVRTESCRSCPRMCADLTTG
mmetsp:Transcript_3081/g.3837  ORF Transcript_3081/g.3837 Transcript_3081/m.3837 type:complete len:203 (+) Transcript_3081:113-721(+)